MSTSKTETRAAPSAAPASAPAPVPRDARLIALILASMGIEDTEPAVLVQLMEFAHRTSPAAHTRVHQPGAPGRARLRGPRRLPAGGEQCVDRRRPARDPEPRQLQLLTAAAQGGMSESSRGAPAHTRCSSHSRRRSTACHSRPCRTATGSACPRRSTA